MNGKSPCRCNGERSREIIAMRRNLETSFESRRNYPRVPRFSPGNCNLKIVRRHETVSRTPPGNFHVRPGNFQRSRLETPERRRQRILLVLFLFLFLSGVIFSFCSATGPASCGSISRFYSWCRADVPSCPLQPLRPRPAHRSCMPLFPSLACRNNPARL